MNNLSSYCGLTDTRMSASDKNLPLLDMYISRKYQARELKLSSFHLEFSFNSIRYICLLFYCLVAFDDRILLQKNPLIW